MLKVADWIARLKYLVLQRKTYYDNHFPGNCGEINKDGSISFDCIGLVKSVINEPDIVYKTSPAGYYVEPEKVIPDTSEIGILGLCTDVKWGNFSSVADGEYLYMQGHGGVYVGDAFGKNSNVNVIECTAAWSGGVLASWVDADGTRRTMKGGSSNGKWEAHGKLTSYIDYSAKKKEPKSIFTDVPTTDKNYKIYKALFGAGIMGKYSDGSFRPSKKVSRKMLAKTLYRFYKKVK